MDKQSDEIPHVSFPMKPNVKLVEGAFIALERIEVGTLIVVAKPPNRPCLVEGTFSTGPDRCKQFGSDGCQWNADAIVDCFYVRGDDVDVSEWEVPLPAPVTGITDKLLDEEPE